MFDRVKNFVFDNEFKLTFYANKIHIINYLDIISLSDNRISLMIPDAKLIIKGDNLLLNKLLDKEVLISGKLLSIEVDYHE